MINEMNLSFREKSLWIDLLATLGIAAYYAVELSSFSAEQLTNIEAVMALLWDVVVLCILVSVVSHIVLSAHDKKSVDAPLDEREELAELRATRIGYWLLLAGISVPVVLYGLELTNPSNIPFQMPAFAPLHTMVIFFIAAEILVTGNQLWRLRREL